VSLVPLPVPLALGDVGGLADDAIELGPVPQAVMDRLSVAVIAAKIFVL
jgi:hypothetical protein